MIETVGGKRVGTVLEGQKRFGEDIRDNLRTVRDLRVGVPQPNGPPLQSPISQLAQISVEEGPAQVSRERISRPSGAVSSRIYK